MELFIGVLIFIVVYWVLKTLFKLFVYNRINSIKNDFERRAREASGANPNPQAEEEPASTPGEKLDLEEMVKRKFDKDQGEYVDFEDVKE